MLPSADLIIPTLPLRMAILALRPSSADDVCSLNSQSIPSETLTILPPLSQIAGWNTPGLAGNTIFDVLDVDSYGEPVSNYIHVNSSTFWGQCGWISQLEQVAYSDAEGGELWQINTTFGLLSVESLSGLHF